MKLEVGKRYRNGVGEVIQIVEYDAKDTHPYTGDDGTHYRQDGQFCLRPCAWLNLVSEVPGSDPDPKWVALLEVLRYLSEDNELAQHALRRLEQALDEEGTQP